MASTTPQTSDPAPADASTGQLISQLSTQMSTLVRGELELAKAELQQSAKSAGTSVGLFGGAGVVALYGVGALIACAILALAIVLPAWLAALIVAVALFVVAGVLALVAKRKAARVAPPVERTVESVKQDVASLKEGAHHGRA